MTEIYLIRHAQAEGNIYRMMQGQWDGDVTDMGLRQIDALAQRFKEQHIDAVYTSDLYRTRLTASALTRYHAVPFYPTKLLREINVGPWETKFFGNVFHEEPERAHNFIFEPDLWYKEGAETFKEVGDRAYPALEEIARKHEGQIIAAVSHGVTIRCIMARVTGIPLRDVETLPICRNTAVSKLIWDGEKFSCEYYNDYSHLLPLGDAGWSSTGDLRDECFNPAEEREWYEKCYEDAWLAAHGDTKGFCGHLYYESALMHYKDDNCALMHIYDKDESVGLIELDTRRSAAAGIGWISLIYLKPEYRNRGYGIQLLARALFKYSQMGRRAIRLHVAEDNKAAIAFYKKYGFELRSYESAASGRLLLMEKSLGSRRS